MDGKGELNVIESTLNDKEKDLLKQNEEKIKQVSKQLLAIHNAVYSY